MTATFGKLNHETLTLEPGLNVIHAPNEWGKSTWCAFLINMLYGIETRARSTGSGLADKEHYAPWSGAPMSGRIELNWNGRDITIERTSTGRTPFGAFQAYETETGLNIPELNGANCGQQLLGVERSVFQRAGFLRLADLPVTADDALRRRLNNLVTTGDESGAGDKLSGSLRDLKNKCRSNRTTGLLPEAETERELLHSQLNELYDLKKQTQQIQERQQTLDTQVGALDNHRIALRHAASQQGQQQLDQARESAEAAQAQWDALSSQIQGLPTPEQLHQAQAQAQQLQAQETALQLRRSSLPPEPAAAPAPSCYEGMTPEAAQAQAQEDLLKLQALESKKNNTLWVALYCIFAGIALAVMVFLNQNMVWILGGAAVGLCGVILALLLSGKTRKLQAAIHQIYDRHPGLSPDRWLSHVQQYAQAQKETQEKQAAWEAQKQALEQDEAALAAQISSFASGEALAACLARYAEQLTLHGQWERAKESAQQTQKHLKALEAVAQPAPAPQYPDDLSFTQEETERKLTQARFEQQQLQLKLGQCKGRAEALGQESAIRARLDALNRRIARLEDHYYALELAQDALFKASSTLQRKFAPRIAKQAQELMGRLTDGRYERLSMAEDLSLNTSAQQEDTLRSIQWRSDGTMDQLYLALRLSVARELTPQAPLILDDALVRFDDRRLEKALEILKEEAREKQVILFTCQNRESQMI